MNAILLYSFDFQKQCRTNVIARFKPTRQHLLGRLLWVYELHLLSSTSELSEYLSNVSSNVSNDSHTKPLQIIECYDDLNVENLKGAIEMVELPCEICWACTLVLAYFQETRVLATWVSKRQFMMALTLLILPAAYFIRVSIEWLWSKIIWWFHWNLKL